MLVRTKAVIKHNIGHGDDLFLGVSGVVREVGCLEWDDVSR